MENLGPLSLPLSFFGTAVIVLLAIVLYFAGRRHYGPAAFWTALLLAGQACALQLVASGPVIRLQMFQPWGDLFKMPRGIFFAAFIAQAAIVFWGIRRYWPVIKQHRLRLLTWPRLLLLLLLLAYAATTITPEWAQSLVAGNWRDLAIRTASNGSKIALGLLMVFTGLANLALAAATIPAEKWDRFVAWWRSGQRSWLPWVAAAWTVVASVSLAWLALDAMPHVPDEVSYVFQAKYLSTGRLSLPPPPDEQALFLPFLISDHGKWYGTPPIGWPALLALGYFVGVPWVVNPVLGGLAVLLAHALARNLYGNHVADATALLLAFSPWHLFLSASLMPHSASLVLALVAFVGVERARRQPSVWWAGATGLAVGALLHVRPLEAVVVAAVAGIWWLSAGLRQIRPAALASCIAAGILMTALFLAYNRHMTGDPLLLPLNTYTDLHEYPGANRYGFGEDVGNFGWRGLDALPGHGAFDVFMNTNQNLYLVQFELFGWAAGSLLFVALLLLWGRWRRDALLWMWCAAVWVAMSGYWFSGGPDFGARYWYLMVVPLAVLTVRGAEDFAEKSRSAGWEAGQRVWAFVAIATLTGALNLLVWRSLDKYSNYRGMRPDVQRLAKENNFGRSLVLIRGRVFPDYSAAAAFNPPLLEPSAEGPIFARDLGPDSVERLRAYFKDRNVWIVEGPTVTGGRFRLAERPPVP